jgi:hypothetical protein
MKTPTGRKKKGPQNLTPLLRSTLNCRMRSLLAILAVVLATLTVVLATPVTSPLPCTFVCPPTDLQGRPLLAHSNSNSQLFCRYDNIPNDFFCKYFLVSIPKLLSLMPIDIMRLFQATGLQKQDHDQGECPTTATTYCPPTRKRNAIPQSPRAPQPGARSVRPGVMKIRAELGKRKRSQK